MALSYTTLVNIDADAALKLSEYISSKLSSVEEGAAYLAECRKHIESAKSQPLVNKFLEQHNVLLNLESDEGRIQILVFALLLSAVTDWM